MEPERLALAHSFLHQHGWGAARLDWLPGDASFRRYARLSLDGQLRLLMDAPPPRENVAPYLMVAELLRERGLSAPTVFAADPTHGFVLLEDFGNQTFTRLLRDGPQREDALYTLATDTLIHLHRQPVPDALPPYSQQKLLDEVSLFTDWAVPEPLQSEHLRTSWTTVWAGLLAALPATAPVTVHRDYHVDNLMVLDGRSGIATCGLLDFQDAVTGHPVYDLVSLLQDARRDVSPGTITAMLARYQASLPLDMDAYYLLGTQRALKIIGIFNRLHKRDGKPAYLVHLPRVWRLVEANITACAALAPLADWFRRHPDIIQAAMA